MNLIEALQAMEKGKKVRKTYWSGKEYAYMGLGGNVFHINPRTQDIDLYSLVFFNLQQDDWELCEKTPFLDLEEKAYLESVLRPFREKVAYIKKQNSAYEEFEEIQIVFKRAYARNQCMYFPNFNKDKMYKGMELGKAYTLKELGLFERD